MDKMFEKITANDMFVFAGEDARFITDAHMREKMNGMGFAEFDVAKFAEGLGFTACIPARKVGGAEGWLCIF